LHKRLLAWWGLNGRHDIPWTLRPTVCSWQS